VLASVGSTYQYFIEGYAALAHDHDAFFVHLNLRLVVAANDLATVCASCRQMVTAVTNTTGQGDIRIGCLSYLRVNHSGHQGVPPAWWELPGVTLVVEL
jgi:hypothetical protein